MVVVSGEQQGNSVIQIHVSILPQTPLPSRLPRNVEQGSLWYIVGPCWLSILNIAVCVFWPCISISDSLTTPSPIPLFFFLILTCNTCPISASSSCHASCSVGSPLPHTELSHEFINTLWSFLVNLTSSHSLELHLHHRNIFPNPFSSLTSPWLFPVWPSRFQLTSPCSALLWDVIRRKWVGEMFTAPYWVALEKTLEVLWFGFTPMGKLLVVWLGPGIERVVWKPVVNP